ncbi:hypothetical protein J7K52_02460 [Candidatus Bathyarchaeota archaeon]|nr:hypothetical protein [Candidatus Bathyarchaeota archaeon]PDM26232.1 MAG: hypothetical protein CP083_04905 [Candidatus Bathyarchaeota archaeon B24-2]RLG97454.1 MAG: hypothetical protein DRO28_04205 [Candidatus Bathyarchaeota archaeon]HDN63195.1 hypothetical protein [Candidatus Bathyarchaeota archaeon]
MARNLRDKKIQSCPSCGFVFDVSYGRSFACSGCPSVLHCEYVKCPKCGFEFPVQRRTGTTKLL